MLVGKHAKENNFIENVERTLSAISGQFNKLLNQFQILKLEKV